jgi:hypothetical protein
MAESGAARSGPCSLTNDMTRSAMTMQEPMKLARVQVRVVPGIVRISPVVVIDGKSG